MPTFLNFYVESPYFQVKSLDLELFDLMVSLFTFSPYYLEYLNLWAHQNSGLANSGTSSSLNNTFHHGETFVCNYEWNININSENPFLHFLTPTQPEMIKETNGRKYLPVCIVIRLWKSLAQEATEAGNLAECIYLWITSCCRQRSSESRMSRL